MVDFNAEATVSTPATDVMRILIIEARENLLQSMETYDKHEADGRNMPTSIMKSRLSNLFRQISQTIKRQLTEEEYNNLRNLIKDKDENTAEDIQNAADIIFNVLDTVGLTRIDTKIKLGGDLKERNKAQGWNA